MSRVEALREKLSRDVGLLAFHVEGRRRPLLLDQVLAAGLKALVPDIPADAHRSLRRQIVDRLLDIYNQMRPSAEQLDLSVLRDRVEELEQRACHYAPFNEAELEYIRTLYMHGVKKAELARIYGVEPATITQVLRKNTIPLVWRDRINRRLDAVDARMGTRILDIAH